MGLILLKIQHQVFFLGMENNKIIFRNRNQNSQSFYFHHFGDGFYLIQDKQGGVIDLYGGGTKNGDTIGKWSRNNGNNQQWKLVVHL